VTDLIDHLRSTVRQQFVELRRSIAGLGEFQLHPAFAARHLTSQMRWNNLTEDAKAAKFRQLMKDTGICVMYYILYTNDSLCRVYFRKPGMQ